MRRAAFHRMKKRQLKILEHIVQKGYFENLTPAGQIEGKRDKRKKRKKKKQENKTKNNKNDRYLEDDA